MESSFSVDQILQNVKSRLESKKVLSDSDREDWDKGRSEAIRQFSKTYHLRNFIRVFQESGELPVEMITEKEKSIQLEEFQRISTKPPYILITINTSPDVIYDDLFKKVQKFLKKKTISNYIGCFEIRKIEDGTYKGLHCHILVKYEDKPYNFKRGVKNTFKNVCDSNNPHILNFVYISQDRLDNEIDYIKGIKCEKKQVGVQLCKEWRAEINIPEYFESSPTFPCRAAELLE